MEHCRLCAGKHPVNELINITDPKAIELNLVYKIVYCYNIQITTEDLLPRQVCSSCCDRVVSAFEFQEIVEKAQDLLLNTLLEVKEEINNENAEPKPDGRILEVPAKQAEAPDDIWDPAKWKEDENVLPKEGYDEYDNYGNDNTSEYSTDDEKPLTERIEESKHEIQLTDNKEESENSDLVGNEKLKLECQECDTILVSPKKYSEHCINVHNKDPEFSCNQCSEIFDKYSNYKNHLRSHKEISKCHICKRIFRDAKYLTRHMITHSDLRPFECLQCAKTFKTQGLLQSHKKKHLPLELKQKFECEQCHKKFTTKATLTYHAEVHMDNVPEKQFVCDQCGRYFKQKANLNQHLTTHLEIFPYCCHQCPKAFKNVYSLRRHEKNHSDLVPFKCDICLKGFRHKRALKRHGNIHLDTLPYECEYCQKRFREKSYLRIHLRQHTGERPYSCMECNHHFTNDSNFIKHIKGRHGLDNFSVANQRQYPFIN